MDQAQASSGRVSPMGRPPAGPVSANRTPAVPKLQVPAWERSVYPGARSLAQELDPEHLKEVETIDRSIRWAAFQKIGLAPEAFAQAESIYRESDRLWLAAEQQRDETTGLLLPEARDQLEASDRYASIELMHALGAATAGRIRSAERMGYRELIQKLYRSESPSSFPVLLAGRRLEVQMRRSPPP